MRRIGSAVRRSRPDAQPGNEKEFAISTIAPIRSDTDAFSDAEIAILVNHGCLLADISVTVHTPQLIAQATRKQVPCPERLNETKAKDALKCSQDMWRLGRR